MLTKLRRLMARWKGTTTERGYGNSHQLERRRRLAQWRPGDLCAHCGQPMLHRWLSIDGRRVSALDLPHTTDRTGYMPGLSHRHCNRSEGVTRRNRQRGMVTGWRTSRAW